MLERTATEYSRDMTELARARVRLLDGLGRRGWGHARAHEVLPGWRRLGGAWACPAADGLSGAHRRGPACLPA